MASREERVVRMGYGCKIETGQHRGWLALEFTSAGALLVIEPNELAPPEKVTIDEARQHIADLQDSGFAGARLIRKGDIASRAARDLFTSLAGYDAPHWTGGNMEPAAKNYDERLAVSPGGKIFAAFSYNDLKNPQMGMARAVCSVRLDNE